MKERDLVRECREELGITVAFGDVFTSVTHVYPNPTAHIMLINAGIAEGEPQLLEHEDLRWITPEEIDAYDFCPADETILKEVKELACWHWQHESAALHSR